MTEAGRIQNQKQEPHTKMWGKRNRSDKGQGLTCCDHACGRGLRCPDYFFAKRMARKCDVVSWCLDSGKGRFQ